MIRRRCERLAVDGPVGKVSALSWDGPQEKVPVLLLHPMNTAGAAWTEVAVRLPRPVVAVDYRGHGLSDPGGPYTPAAFAADALAVLDSMGWDQVHLAGGSIGGAVCVEVAARSTAEVRSIACFGASLRSYRSEADLVPALAEMRRLGVGEWFAAHGASNFGPRTRPGAVDTLAELAGGRDAEMVAEIITTVVTQSDSRAAAAALPKRPALVAVGTHDVTCPRRAAEEIARYLRTEVTVLDGVGHLPMIDVPEDVADLMTELHRRADSAD